MPIIPKILPARTSTDWLSEPSYDRADRCRLFLLSAGLITGDEDRAIRRRMERIAVKRYRVGKRFLTTPEASPATETPPDRPNPEPRLDDAGEC